MSWCDAKLPDPDDQIHSTGFDHVCDEQSKHGDSHMCSCGLKWPNE